MMPTVRWNDQVKLIISDVDDTIAELYVEASPGMIRELTALLDEGKMLLLISGQGIRGIFQRVVRQLPPRLRKRVIVGHCSGVELWGFDDHGDFLLEPFYSRYAPLPEAQKSGWRAAIHQLIAEFDLRVFSVMPVREFRQVSNGHPLAIMVEDRGPQITFEMPNSIDLSPKARSMVGGMHGLDPACHDLRVPVVERAQALFTEQDLPFVPRLAVVFGIDFVVTGVSKATAVSFLMEHASLLHSLLALSPDELDPARDIEIWGDKFSVQRGGIDRHMSEALPRTVRSISFREEDPTEFLPGYRTVVWDGQERLHHGLLEFLRSRHPPI